MDQNTFATIKNACSSGDLDTLRKLFRHYPEQVGITAAHYGSIECLQFLHNNGFTISDICTHEAARCGHIECLKYLDTIEGRVIDDEVKDEILFETAREGCLESLVYLHENGYRWTPSVVTLCFSEGHLECLKYACENQCPVPELSRKCAEYLSTKEPASNPETNDDDLLYDAAITRNLKRLTKLHEKGCAWTDSIISGCIEGGCMKCLTYACENGCLVPERIHKCAAYLASL